MWQLTLKEAVFSRFFRYIALFLPSESNRFQLWRSIRVHMALGRSNYYFLERFRSGHETQLEQNSFRRCDRNLPPLEM
jgi:hypothetical protein